MSRVTLNQLPEPVKRGQVHPKDYWVGGQGHSAMVSLLNSRSCLLSTAVALFCHPGILEASERGTVVWLQNDDYFNELKPLVEKLNKAVPEAKYDAKQLVFLLVQLLHFQEAALGKEVGCGAGRGYDWG